MRNSGGVGNLARAWANAVVRRAPNAWRGKCPRSVQRDDVCDPRPEMMWSCSAGRRGVRTDPPRSARLRRDPRLNCRGASFRARARFLVRPLSTRVASWANFGTRMTANLERIVTQCSFESAVMRINRARAASDVRDRLHCSSTRGVGNEVQDQNGEVTQPGGWWRGGSFVPGAGQSAGVPGWT
jgi:hypothetical protein